MGRKRRSNKENGTKVRGERVRRLITRKGTRTVRNTSRSRVRPLVAVTTCPLTPPRSQIVSPNPPIPFLMSVWFSLK